MSHSLRGHIIDAEDPVSCLMDTQTNLYYYICKGILLTYSAFIS